MLPDDKKDLIFQGLRQGRYSLLLGAGFSMTSTSQDGRSLPSGGELGRELASKFSLPDSYALHQLTAAIDPRELSDYLSQRFLNCNASSAAKLVSNFIWQFIFTFNVDDVLHDVYLSRWAKQKPKFISFRRSFEQTEDSIAELRVIHLHGSVRFPDDGYVFSAQQYGSLAAQDSTWFKIATDYLVEQPFIIIGCTLNEVDLEYYFARRTGLTSESKTVLPSLFVTRKLDKVLEKLCERFGFIPVEAKSDEFFSFIDTETGEKPTPLDLILPRKDRIQNLLEGSASERSIRIFFRQWSVIRHDEVPASSASVPSLLRGTEPQWEHITRNEDVIRQDVRSLTQEITNWFNSNPKDSFVIVLSSAAGEGKSVTLMRTAYELARSAIPVFNYNTINERLIEEAAGEVLALMDNKPMIIFIDNLADHAIQMGLLIDRLQKAKKIFFVLAGERSQRFQHIRNAMYDIEYKRRNLSTLNSSETLELVKILRREGLLGRQAGLPDSEIVRKADKKSFFRAILSIGGSQQSIRNIVIDEWKGFSTNNHAQTIFAIIALAHSCGQPVRIAILQRATGLSMRDITAAMGGDLIDNIVYLPPMGERVQTRHRILAETLMREITIPDRLQAFISLAKTLAPYISRKAIMKGTPEARLVGRLLDYDDMVHPLLADHSEEFYLNIQEDWAWNSRYWEQRALLELSRDLNVALRFAEHAVGLENHPQPLTTLAKVHFTIANRTGDLSRAIAHVRQAVNITDSAIEKRVQRNRIERHSFDLAIRSLLDFLGKNHHPSKEFLIFANESVTKVESYLTEMVDYYPGAELARVRRQWSSIKDRLNLR